MTLRAPFQQRLLQSRMHGQWLRRGFCLGCLQNAAAPPVVGMLNLKDVSFKLAILPPQSPEFATANPECSLQENQQLIAEFKPCKSKLELFRRQNHWLLFPFRTHAYPGTGSSFPSPAHLYSGRDGIARS